MKRLWTFLGITFGITYAWEFTMLALQDKLLLTLGSMGLTVGLAVVMLVPLLGVVLTTVIFKDKLRELPLRPRIKGNVKWYLLALLGPSALTLLGAAVFFIVHPESFDPEMSTVIEATGAQLEAAGQPMDRNLIVLMSLAQAAMAMLLAPFFNMIFAFGEEIGWRGYMMPRLCEKMGAKKAVIVGGVIWGLWHAPAIAMGHNYGTDYPGFPWLGIFAMCCFCVAMGTLLTWVSFKVGSVWPAALAHGAINATASMGALFVKGDYDLFVGPMAAGYLGGSAFIVAAVIVFFNLNKMPCSFPAAEAKPVLKEEE